MKQVLIIKIVFYFLYGLTAHAQSNKKILTGIIQKVQAAHGGMYNWKKIKTIRFNHHIVFGTDSARQWWISREMTDLNTMRFYETRPFENATIVYDGIKTWTTNWKQPNPPAMLVNNHLLQQVLPFITSHRLAVVTREAEDKLPGNDTVSFIVLKIRFKPSANFDSAKYYKLFIHPVTYRMAGWVYNITHRAQLKNMGMPVSASSYGPFINKVHTYKFVKGILLPEQYDTYNPQGKISGNHLVLGYEFNKKIDKRKFKKPGNAKVDNTSVKYKLMLN